MRLTPGHAKEIAGDSPGNAAVRFPLRYSIFTSPILSASHRDDLSPWRGQVARRHGVAAISPRFASYVQARIRSGIQRIARRSGTAHAAITHIVRGSAEHGRRKTHSSPTSAKVAAFLEALRGEHSNPICENDHVRSYA